MKVVSQSSDDAEELKSTGAVSLQSTDLELGEDYDGAQIVGLRFQDLDIPRRAAISQAYLEFTADRVEDEPASLVFHGQAIDSAPTFSRSQGRYFRPHKDLGLCGLEQRASLEQRGGGLQDARPVLHRPGDR